ncbi:DUF4250 domain-containing protein [Limnobaculum zhutongyuii]|uniref:DUF4250 domain-containing protein n=1 Tax=Limnobaculum zhutongyuii TaxID=2498113 RepID=A0A411WK22_9GAMM|nr:DUF4250 domain-containing protein [Limnobaculum zhutongyuii]QBH96522.1 DUF4250 domain-containing protein [Limnobaculum zhutongyuii]TQS90447.1 DUF4250 domain-containing protein [Limnobaculum zhutongyuii]
MQRQNFLAMDPHLLFSIVNMKLRDEFESLDDLARSYDIDREALIKKLSDAGYQYQSSNNQFR